MPSIHKHPLKEQLTGDRRRVESGQSGSENDSRQDGQEGHEEDAEPKAGIRCRLMDDPVWTRAAARHANAEEQGQERD